MARKQPHEDHVNHEAWAIPYGDLITLLLAFFVVMYAVSSVNEGKYRVMSEALSEAFGGPPRSLKPIQVGKISHAASQVTPIGSKSIASLRPAMGGGMRALNPVQAAAGRGDTERGAQALKQLGQQIDEALADLVRQGQVSVRRTQTTLEVEIKTDILFPSGSSLLSAPALPVIDRLSEILAPYANPMRIEGHTDNLPIATAVFPSNWELSAARAAAVVHRMAAHGVNPRRLAVLGYGEFQPVADNLSASGRNQNRRVVIVILAAAGDELPVASLKQVGDAATAEPTMAPKPEPTITAPAIAPPPEPAPEPAAYQPTVERSP